MRTITLCQGSGAVVDTLTRAVRLGEAMAILEHYILTDARVQAGTIHNDGDVLEFTAHAS